MRAVPLALLALAMAAFGLPSMTKEVTAQAATTANNQPKALFITLANNRSPAPIATTAHLTQWNGSFVDHLMQTVTYTMVGNDPKITNTTTTVPVYIIPIKMVYGASNGNRTFDPAAVKVSNGQTLLQNVVGSPMFQKNVTFVQGGTNLGTTQYIDAYQRGNFWSSVSKNTSYHVLVGAPKILPEQTIVVSAQDGSVMANPFSTNPKDMVGTMYVNDFDTALQGFMAKFTQLNPGVLPLFITYDTYLTEAPEGGVCCIGGYHSANGAQPNGQTYAYSTYVDSVGAFSQDVSAMSHEIGEWMDDPFVDNNVNCLDNSLMENGDPLENNPNSGAFPYKVNGFTYNLQSLVFIGYFGAPRSTSVHSWLSFQNDESSVCPGQNVAVTAAAP